MGTPKKTNATPQARLVQIGCMRQSGAYTRDHRLVTVSILIAYGKSAAAQGVILELPRFV